jgi:hypothetical protein
MGLNIKFLIIVFPVINIFNTLRSDNLFLNVLRLVRIFNTTEYRKMTSIRLHLCA